MVALIAITAPRPNHLLFTYWADLYRARNLSLPKELGIYSTGKALVDLDIIKTYSLLQHKTINKTWFQAKGTTGLFF